MVDQDAWQFLGMRTITRRDRSLVSVDAWQRPCARCGALFEILVPAGRTADTSSSFASLHCPAHHLTRDEVLARFITGAARARVTTAASALRWSLMTQALSGDIADRDPAPLGQRSRARLSPEELQAHRKASNLRYRLRVRNRLEAEQSGTRIFHLTE